MPAPEQPSKTAQPATAKPAQEKASLDLADLALFAVGMIPAGRVASGAVNAGSEILRGLKGEKITVGSVLTAGALGMIPLDQFRKLPFVARFLQSSLGRGRGIREIREGLCNIPTLVQRVESSVQPLFDRLEQETKQALGKLGRDDAFRLDAPEFYPEFDRWKEAVSRVVLDLGTTSLHPRHLFATDEAAVALRNQIRTARDAAINLNRAVSALDGEISDLRHLKRLPPRQP